MVQAILEGKKTQTRRVIKPQPVFEGGYDYPHENELGIFWKKEESYESIEAFTVDCPYGKPGDTLWVRETWQLLPSGFDEIPPEMNYIYRATDKLSSECTKWRPSIFMPRTAARLFLTVTNVRVERLQEITKEDARAEGINVGTVDTEKYEKSTAYRIFTDNLPIARFGDLWNSINTKRGYGWEKNPWVWIVEFKKIERGVE